MVQDVWNKHILDSYLWKPMYSTPIKQEFDDPLFDKHIEQDISISNAPTLAQPHQTYSEIVQKQNNIKLIFDKPRTNVIHRTSH